MPRITNLPRLLSALRKDFPLSLSMWQVVRETQDGLMEANFYTDEWPDFTTVISQESAPRLSEVADLRIHTRDKEKVMQVINGANLLDKTRNGMQLILYLTREKDNLSPHLVSALSHHPAAEGRAVTWYSSPVCYIPDFPANTTSNPFPPPPGYVIKDLRPEHAELVARNWNFKNWFTEITPYEAKRKFVEHLIRKFIGVGAFVKDNPEEPVAWTFRKPGGIYGISFTTTSYRRNNLSTAATFDVISRVGTGKDTVYFAESRYGDEPFVQFGTSHAIVLHTPLATPNSVHSNL